MTATPDPAKGTGHDSPAQDNNPKTRSRRWIGAIRTKRSLIILTALIASGLIYALWYITGHAVQHARSTIDEKLETILQAKLSQLGDWRGERIADARAVAANPLLSKLLTHHAETSLQQELATYFEKIRRYYEYSAVMLYDSDGSLVYSSAAQTLTPQGEASLDLPQGSETRMGDVNFSQDGSPWIDIVARVRDPGGAERGRLTLRLDPRTRLLPMLGKLPISEPSVTTFLCKQEGNGLRPMGVFRYGGKEVAGSMPLSQMTGMPASGVLHPWAKRGAFEHTNHQGLKVTSVSRPIPETPWVLIVQTDARELRSLINTELSQTLSTVAAVGLLAFILILSWARSRRDKHEELRAKLERERTAVTARLAALMQSANDVILVLDQKQRIVEANDRCRSVYGLPPEDMHGLSLADLQSPDSPTPPGPEDLESGCVFETFHQHRSGNVVPVEISSRAITLAEGKLTLLLVRDITERHRLALENRRQEAQLRTSERRLHFLITATPAIIYSLSADGRFITTYISTNVDQILGYPVSHFLSTPTMWMENVHPDDLPDALKVMQTADDGATHQRSYRFRHAKGGWRWMHEEFRLIKDTDGTPLEYVGYWFDITERKMAEDALALREEIYSTIVNQAADAIVLIEPASQRFIEFNKAAHEGMGYSREEFAKLTIPDLQAEHSPEQVTRNIEALRSSGQLNFESVHRRKDGKLRQVRVSSKIVNVRGSVYAAAIWSDITEAKQAEADLRKLSTAVEQSPIAIVITDLEGRIEYVNPAFTAASGYEAREVLGQNPRLLKSGLTSAETFADLWTTITSGRTWRGELINKKKSGQIHVELAVITPVTNREGKATHYMAIKEDITERKRMETTVRESRDRLAKAEHIAKVGSWELHIPTGKLSWSDEMFSLLDLDPSSALPSKELFLSFLPPSEYADIKTLADDAVVNCTRYALEHRLIMRDGRVKFVASVGEVIESDNGTPIRAVGTMQDVSDRKLVELELQDLVRGLRMLHQVSQLIENLDNTRSEVLKQACALLPGTTRHPRRARAFVCVDGDNFEEGPQGEFSSKISAPIHIGDKEAGILGVGYVQEAGASTPVPFLQRELDLIENLALTLGLGMAEREAVAAIRRFNAELEQKIAQRTDELARSNSELEALLKSIPDMVLRLNRTGSILNFQQADKDTPLGQISRQDISAKTGPLADLSGTIMRTGMEAVEKNRIVTAETTLQTPIGDFIIELRCARVSDEDFVAFARDITARKRLEEETAQMLEKERQVSEMKTRFISTTSHEFRTPMAAAIGSADMLINHEARLSPGKRRELLERIRTSMFRMSEMLEDLLTLNRMDANKAKPVLTSLDLTMMISSAVEEIRLGDHDAHPIVMDLQPLHAPIISDENMLHHILTNLLSNAVRYSQAGSKVEVSCFQEGSHVLIEVSDHGIGIPPEDLHRLFTPFERGSNVGNIKGTGLGLCIVHRMTLLLGGSISLRPVEGGGTCFILSLPQVGNA